MIISDVKFRIDYIAQSYNMSLVIFTGNRNGMVIWIVENTSYTNFVFHFRFSLVPEINSFVVNFDQEMGAL